MTMNRPTDGINDKIGWIVLLITAAIAIAGAVLSFVFAPATTSGGCTIHDLDPKDHKYKEVEC